jgi:hypothetical protein
MRWWWLLLACADRPLYLPSQNADLALHDLARTVDLASHDLARPIDLSIDLAQSLDLSLCRTPPGLLSWWRANDDASDELGVNPGATQGPMTFTGGIEQQAFQFPGAGFVEVAQPTTPGGAITVAAWIRLDALPPLFGPVMARWLDNVRNDRGFFLSVVGDGSVRWDISTDSLFTIDTPNTAGDARASADNALVISNTRLPLAEWHHVAGRFDGVLTVFIDGQPETSISAPFQSIFQTAEPLLIGAGDLNLQPRRFLDGALDDVRLYSRALDDAEIKQVFDLRGNRCL